MDAGHFDVRTAYAAVNRIRVDDMKPHIYKTNDGGKTWKEIVNGLPDDPVNVVREDPVRKGLLYAGTERAVYVSFDEGEHWQPLRKNMEENPFPFDTNIFLPITFTLVGYQPTGIKPFDLL